jgi:hypothetical protein
MVAKLRRRAVLIVESQASLMGSVERVVESVDRKRGTEILIRLEKLVVMGKGRFLEVDMEEEGGDTGREAGMTDKGGMAWVSEGAMGVVDMAKGKDKDKDEVDMDNHKVVTSNEVDSIEALAEVEGINESIRNEREIRVEPSLM